MEKGDVLVSRTTPGEGKVGTDIHGKVLGARMGKDIALPAGKNIEMSEDKRAMLASISGRLRVVAGRVIVSATLLIDGDVTMSVGNIDFDGDVEITGNVNAGFTVNAAGNVVVHGLVEAAEINAGGDIIIHNGVSGSDKAVLKADGKIFAKYVERATLDAGQGLRTEFALHSKLMSETYVNLLHGRGTVIGGTVSAGTYVVAQVIGTDAGTATNVDIGISPRKRARQEAAENELGDIKSAIGRMELAVKSAESNAAIREKNPGAIQDIKNKIDELTLQKDALEKELTDLEADMQSVLDGQIHVEDTIYRDTRISIGKSTYLVKTENRHVTYFREKQEIASKVYSFTAVAESKEKN